MNLSDEYINGLLREMGVDVDCKKPPHWVEQYSKSIIGDAKYGDGYMCSRCGKHSYARTETCSGCNSVMTNSKAKGGTK